MPFVIYDKGDFTFHVGGGHWSSDRKQARLYRTSFRATREMGWCDQGKILVDRLCVMRVMLVRERRFDFVEPVL